MQVERMDGRVRRGIVGVVVGTSLMVLAGCTTTGNSPVASAGDAAAKRSEKPVDPAYPRLAEKAIEDGRFEDAKRIIERIFLNDPDHPVAQLMWAEVLLAKGSPDDALQMFEKLESQQDLSAKAVQGKGLALIRQGAIDQAQIAFETAVSSDPQLWRSWNALGYIHDFRGQWAKSAAAYERAIEASPGNAIVYNNRGYSRILQKQYAEAADDLHSALRIQPDMKSAQINLQLALALGGQYERALLGIRKEDRGEALNNIGYMALVRGDHETAQSYFVQSLETDASYNVVAHRNLDYLLALEKIKTKPDADSQ